jgi:MoaA/NifB/PqqE/SkfB family radical SAM enzyme
MTLRPISLTIDACTNCRLRCVRCPVTARGYAPGFGKTHLTLENFKRLLDDNPQLVIVHFDSHGEMFQNPELLEIVACADQRRLPTFCSAGVHLNYATREALEGLVKYRLRSLVCSIDGATDAVYRMYRVGGDLTRVINNVRAINHFKTKYRSPYPALTWQFIVFGHNEHEIPPARALATKLGMRFVPKLNWDPDYSPIRDPEFVKAQTGWNHTTRDEFDRATGRDLARRACHSLWNSPRISADGQVTGCCRNVWSGFGGNAFHDGYVAAANGERIAFARKMLLGETPARDDIPCATCYVYARMRATGAFLKRGEILFSMSPKYRVFEAASRIPGLHWLPAAYRSGRDAAAPRRRGAPSRHEEGGPPG